jgi:hypothetical protein
MKYRKPKIGWILSMDRGNASSRLQGFLIHEWMLKQGIDSHIVATHFQQVSGPFDVRFMKVARALRKGRFTHAVFEAPEWSACQLSVIWKSWGGTSVAVRCDRVGGLYDNYFDATILPTVGLADALGVRRRNIIPDSVEVPPDLFKKSYAATPPIKVVWVGHQSYSTYVTQLVNSLESRPTIGPDFSFTLISRGSFAHKQWSEETVLTDILACDIALIPIPLGQWFETKSSNRLAMMMALGMPVVASRIPSYLEVAQDGRNVRFVNDEEDIAEALVAMRDAPFRAALGQAARADLGDTFSIERIGPFWRDAILGAADARGQMPANAIKAKLLSRMLSFF